MVDCRNSDQLPWFNLGMFQCSRGHVLSETACVHKGPVENASSLSLELHVNVDELAFIFHMGTCDDTLHATSVEVFDGVVNNMACLGHSLPAPYQHP